MRASLSVDRGFACARVAFCGSRFRLCARRFWSIEVSPVRASLSVDRGFACARVAFGGSRFRLCARRFPWI